MILHFLHNDALIIIMIIGNCRMSKVLVDGGSCVNIMCRGTLDRMEDTLETAQAMINSQTQCHLYGFDRNVMRSPSKVILPVHADPYNVILEFYVVDIESPHNAILGRPWLYMMKVVSSTYHQLV